MRRFMGEGDREPASVGVFRVLHLFVLADEQVFAGVVESLQGRSGHGGGVIAVVSVIINVSVVVVVIRGVYASVMRW